MAITKEYIKKMNEWSKILPLEIESEARKIETLLAKYNSFDIIANMSFMNLSFNPETFKEYSHEGLSAYVEYITLLCLKKPFSSGEEFIVTGEDIETIQKLIESIFIKEAWLLITRGSNRQTEIAPTDLEKLQFLIRTHELIVRNPAYQHHHYEVIQHLFAPFEKELTNKIGFTAQDAINLTKASSQLVYEKLYNRRNKAISEFKRIKEGISSYRLNSEMPQWCDEQSKAFIEELSKLTEQELEKRLQNRSVAWTFLGFGETTSFSVKELSDFSGINEISTAAFLKLLALDFGCVPQDFYVPSPVHQLKKQPLVVYAGKYLCPSPILLDWAIQPLLENTLKSSEDGVWQRYERHRHDYLLSKSLSLLAGVMPDALIKRNLEYDIVENGTTKSVELDGLVICDSILFLIEAKAGSITEPARRGAPDRLKAHLKELLAKAHSQGIRAKKYIKESSSPVFREQHTKTKFTLSREAFKDIYLISLLLEPLGHLTSTIHAQTDLDVFEREDLPWMINIYELMVIADCIDYPPMLPHYIKRRLRITKQGFLEACDELDLFGYYLCEGLFFKDKSAIAPADFMTLNTYTTEFDSYYFYKMGARKTPAPKPKQKMSEEFRHLLNSIELTKMEGRVGVAMALLDLGGDARKEVIDKISELKRRLRKDNNVHNMHLIIKDDDGFCFAYVCAPSEEIIDTGLLTYCKAKKYALKAKKCLGIGDVGKDKYDIRKIVHLDYPWAYDILDNM